MRLLDRISQAREPQRSIGINEYISLVSSFGYGGLDYPLSGVQTTMSGENVEQVSGNLTGLAQAAYASHGPVFALMMVRMLIFSAIRFQWQRIRDGQPSDLFGSTELGLLERPWPGGTTQDMLTRVILYADLAGNAFPMRWTPLSRMGGDEGTEVALLRPDWVDVVLQKRMTRFGQVGWRKLGYAYYEGGKTAEKEPVPLTLREVGQFAPLPDPTASWRGMSWLTPIIRELQNDKLMSTHQRKFFENAATPNLVVRLPQMSLTDFKAFKAEMDANHLGVNKAYKTLYLGGGADVTVAGLNFQQMDFSKLQGRAETRLASAAGIAPAVAGFSEGLQGSSLNAGNFKDARRRTSDGTMHPLWQNIAGSMEPILVKPPPAFPDETPEQIRLWYDATGVPFLREDEKDAAEIQAAQAQTIRTLVDGGYEPDSVIKAVNSGDWRLLKHSGLYSVQLQAAGAQQPALPAGSDDE